MAFSSGTIWHNWSTGSAANGGGFDPTNASFAADLTTDTNTGNTSAPVVSSASYNFVAGDVGAWVFIQSGTNWVPGWYQIASVASNKATLSAAIGSAVLYGTVLIGRNYHRPNGLNTTAGVASVGTPTSGVWSVDYSQQTAAALTYTDMVIDGTINTVYTSAANPVGKNIVGNMVNVTSGTGFTVQRVQVVSTSGTQATVDKSLGTLSSTGGNGALGGAVGSSSALTALTQPLVAGNKVYVKGSYTLTVTTTVTAAAKGDITNGRIVVEGFTTYPGDNGSATITSATTSVALFTLNDNDYFEFANLILSHSAATRGTAFGGVTATSSPVWFKNIVVDGCLTMFNSTFLSALNYLESVEIKNTTSTTAALCTQSMSFFYLRGCDIHDNAGDGIRSGVAAHTIFCKFCLFDTNAGIGFNENATAAACTVVLDGCVFVDNTGDGFKITGNTAQTTIEYDNNLFWGNGGYGVNCLETQAKIDANLRSNRNNAYGSNTSGSMVGVTGAVGDVQAVNDPFVNRAGRNFALNNTAGAGALVRALAFPTAFPGGTTSSYRDIGATQHQDSGGGTTVISHRTQGWKV